MCGLRFIARRAFLVRSFKVSLALFSLLALASTGFMWGRAMGARTRTRHDGRGISAMLPFHPRFAGGFSEPEPNPHIPPDQVFEDVLDKVQQYYVDGGGNGARLSNGALARMLASLDDPRTSFLDPVYREAGQHALKGRY